jgi:hypothetical protein
VFSMVDGKLFVGTGVGSGIGSCVGLDVGASMGFGIVGCQYDPIPMMSLVMSMAVSLEQWLDPGTAEILACWWFFHWCIISWT